MKPDFIELELELLGADGAALGRLGGEVVFVPGGLPGELARILAPVKKRGVLWGEVAEILRPSPLRVKPDCQWAGRCGGCDFLHVEESAALKLKAEAALGRMAETLRLDIELVEAPLRRACRTRAALHLDLGAAGLSVGFYDARRKLVEFDRCDLLSPKISAMAPLLRAWAATLPPEAAGPEIHVFQGEISSTNELLQNDSAKVGAKFFSPGADNGPLITLAPSPSRDFKSGRPAPSRLRVLSAEHYKELGLRLAKSFGENFGLFIRPELMSRPKKIAGSLDKTPSAVWPQWELTIEAGPGMFTQTNPAVNKIMVEKILEMAAPAAPGAALDLYSGAGNIALPLSHSSFVVTAVEESPASSALAACHEGRNFRQFRGTAEKALSELVAAGRKFDFISLDPPRGGARDIAPKLAALSPRRVVYVSCHPAALARDAMSFVSLGFRASRLLALDMFPGGSHLETLLLFER